MEVALNIRKQEAYASYLFVLGLSYLALYPPFGWPVLIAATADGTGLPLGRVLGIFEFFIYFPFLDLGAMFTTFLVRGIIDAPAKTSLGLPITTGNRFLRAIKIVVLSQRQLVLDQASYQPDLYQDLDSQ
jgi:hypothetical protein